MKYNVTVKPGTSQEKVIVTGENELIVYLRAKPHDGEANVALVKVLAKHFDVPKTTVEITKGAGSRIKVVEVLGR